MNIDGSENDLFIANNYEEVDEIVAEADQIVTEAYNDKKSWYWDCERESR